jgi:hypothetical protein
MQFIGHIVVIWRLPTIGVTPCISVTIDAAHTLIIFYSNRHRGLLPRANVHVKDRAIVTQRSAFASLHKYLILLEMPLEFFWWMHLQARWASSKANPIHLKPRPGQPQGSHTISQASPAPTDPSDFLRQLRKNLNRTQLLLKSFI